MRARIGTQWATMAMDNIHEHTHTMHYMLCCAIVRRVNIWGIELIFVRLILMPATL